MSCFTAITTQIFSYIFTPIEILSLRHKVFQEYAKVALGPDFTHTFPSFIIICAILIILRRYFRFKVFSNVNFTSFFHDLLNIICCWMIINVTFWYWLIIQNILYCAVWTFWANGEKEEIKFPWWQQVWSSFYPPTAKPPLFSSDLISWYLSMGLSMSILSWTVYMTNKNTTVSNKLLKSSEKHMNNICCSRSSSINREERSISREVEEATDKSEMGSLCSKSDGSVCEFTRSGREISPISYGTNYFKTLDEKHQKYTTPLGVKQTKQLTNDSFKKKSINSCSTCPNAKKPVDNGY